MRIALAAARGLIEVDRTICASLSLPLLKSSAATRYMAGALSRVSEQLESNAYSGGSSKLVLYDLDTQTGRFFVGHARYPDPVPDDALVLGQREPRNKTNRSRVRDL